MRIHFLGTGGYHPNERRHTACVMLPEIGVVFDAGTSVFRLPKRLQTENLDIFLSHAHLDHIAGLTFLLVPMLNGQIGTVRLWGTGKTLDAVREHLLAEAVFPLPPQFEYVKLPSRASVPGGGTITHVPLDHPGGSTGYRLDLPDRSLAYITDTLADRSYLGFIRGVDLLIHECYFPDEDAAAARESGHSHTTPVVELARDAGVSRLLLVHIDPQREEDDPIGLDAARRIFPATEIAEDLMTVEI